MRIPFFNTDLTASQVNPMYAALKAAPKYYDTMQGTTVAHQKAQQQVQATAQALQATHQQQIATQSAANILDYQRRLLHQHLSQQISTTGIIHAKSVVAPKVQKAAATTAQQVARQHVISTQYLPAKTRAGIEATKLIPLGQLIKDRLAMTVDAPLRRSVLGAATHAALNPATGKPYPGGQVLGGAFSNDVSTVSHGDPVKNLINKWIGTGTKAAPQNTGDRTYTSGGQKFYVSHGETFVHDPKYKSGFRRVG